jgi:adenine-specific DNA-methyltransferase
MPRGRRQGSSSSDQAADTYRHPEADLPTRPEIGTQAQFRKKKPPKTYRYDSSLSPALDWDGQNPARELAEALIERVRSSDTLEDARAAAEELARMSSPFLNWAGKAERLSFDVPTLPLFVHERLSTKAILETLKRHRRDPQEALDLFGDPQHSVADQVLRAYEHRDRWVNRLVLGDSLTVMNSLLEYEGLGGQVQMIYIDPPYGVKFGSNFQPFVRKRDVKHNDDAHLTREPEMVQAYRDTWELGLHSYLTYLRDRLLVARELLTPSGSVFVQISDENVHHVREVMDEVFGGTNACGIITFAKTTGAGSPSGGTDLLPVTGDYLLWYAKDREAVKFRQLFVRRELGGIGGSQYGWIEIEGARRPASEHELSDPPPGARLFAHGDMTSQTGGPTTQFLVSHDGREFRPAKGGWKTNAEGMERLRDANRLFIVGNSLRYVRYAEDFPVVRITERWNDTVISGFGAEKLYVVQTHPRVIQRCTLMTTDPGDLVLDPTCGSGTTAYVAEQWGRRWITIDTSRVPLALTRQRILTATFPWYELRDPQRGPAGGFVYERKQNARGEEVGGIVPHVTLKSVANDEPPKEEVLVDRPNTDKSVTRVSGPFVVEATIPTPVDFEGDGIEDSGAPAAVEHGSFVERMIQVLHKSPTFQLGGGRTITLRNVRPPARALSLSAEAVVEDKPVAIVFGPESGAVTDKLVFNAASEANAKQFTHLYVIGFAIQPTARELVEKAADALGIPATYVQASPDLAMGDLLKTMRSSQIFSVCGLPEISIERVNGARGEPQTYRVKLLGLDTFDPITMQPESLDAAEVPAWFLDTSYDDLCFRVSQAFFPRTEAWKNLKRALAPAYEESVWDHLHGTESAPFEADAGAKIAVKVIDLRGNELMAVRSVASAQ